MGAFLSKEEVALAPAAAPHPRGRRRPPTVEAPSNGEWTSTLGYADLACLLQVIESQLLPRLLREFRPADLGPLGSTGR